MAGFEGHFEDLDVAPVGDLAVHGALRNLPIGETDGDPVNLLDGKLAR